MKVNSGGNDQAVVVNSSSAIPNHSQPTNFYHSAHSEGGKDEMCIPHGRKQMVTNGEAAIRKYRTPY